MHSRDHNKRKVLMTENNDYPVRDKGILTVCMLSMRNSPFLIQQFLSNSEHCIFSLKVRIITSHPCILSISFLYCVHLDDDSFFLFVFHLGWFPP